MKKLFFALTILSVPVMVGSCSKAVNCHCVYKTDGTVSHEDDNKINEGSEEKSKSKCAEMSYSSTSTFNGTSTTSSADCAVQ